MSFNLNMTIRVAALESAEEAEDTRAALDAFLEDEGVNPPVSLACSSDGGGQHTVSGATPFPVVVSGPTSWCDEIEAGMQAIVEAVNGSAKLEITWGWPDLEEL